MKVSSQRALSYFHKIRHLEHRVELRTRKITLIKISEGREKTGGRVRGLTTDQISIVNDQQRKVAGLTGCPRRPTMHVQEPGRTRRTCLHLEA